MKTIIALILLTSTLFEQVLAASAQIRDSVGGVQCFANFGTKVGLPSYGISPTYCGDLNDFSKNGGPQDNFKGSNYRYNSLPYHSQYTLCPYDSAGNSQNYYLDNDNTKSISSQYVPKGGVGVYILKNNSTQYDGIKIMPKINQNVMISIYSSHGSNYFELLKIENGDTEIKIDVTPFAMIYVVVLSDGSKIGNFIFNASLFKNLLSRQAIVVIIIGSIAFCTISIAILVGGIKRCKKRAQTKRNKLMNQEKVPLSISSQPCISYNKYTNLVSQPNRNNQPSYQQYSVSQPGYQDSKPLLQNSSDIMSNIQ